MAPPEFEYVECLDGTTRYLYPNQVWEASFVSSSELPSGKTKLEEVDEAFLLSDAKKCVLKVRPQFFHVIYDVIAFVAIEIEKEPEVSFVFDFYHTGGITPEIQQVYDFLYRCLDSSNIKYTTLKSTNDSYIEIRNFYYPEWVPHTLYSSKKVIEFIRKATGVSDKAPYKKVYLSRRKAPTHDELYSSADPKSFPSYVDFFDDIRLDDEPRLESYLKGKGFEIVYPEDFSSLEDQIKFMSEVKLVASCTSAGLLNTLFMQDGQTMLEFQVPLVASTGVGTWTQSLHDFYHPLSYVMKHEYVSIPAMRSVDLILERLETKGYLADLVSK